MSAQFCPHVHDDTIPLGNQFFVFLGYQKRVPNRNELDLRGVPEDIVCESERSLPHHVSYLTSVRPKLTTKKNDEKLRCFGQIVHSDFNRWNLYLSLFTLSFTSRRRYVKLSTSYLRLNERRKRRGRDRKS